MINVKIQVNNLSFSYGKYQVLQIKDVGFEEGKAYGIVGKNGAGKTTFFKCLVNINTSYKGSIQIDYKDVRSNLSTLANVGIVLDDMNLYRNRTGMFNLKYFAGLRGGTSLERVYELANELELTYALEKKVSTYSLGMMKKLQLLISLMNDAKILIFDEPFRGLDAKTVEWFRNYLNELKKQGRTILISSHVQEDIESISDVVYVLEYGEFRHRFDLNDKEQKLIYTVEVSNPQALVALLDEQGIKQRSSGNVVQFLTVEDVYRELFKKAVASDVEFLQIKKESQFLKYVK